MARLFDLFPERRVDPSYRTKSYVSRRLGASDPVRDRRRQRSQSRTPQASPTIPIQTVDAAGINVTAAEDAKILRARGGAGVTDTLWVRIRNAAGAAVLSQLALIGHTHPPAAVSVVQSNSHTVAAGGVSEVLVCCTGGTRPIGGGWASDTTVIHVIDSYPQGSCWSVTIYNPDVSVATNAIYAICLA